MLKLRVLLTLLILALCSLTVGDRLFYGGAPAFALVESAVAAENPLVLGPYLLEVEWPPDTHTLIPSQIVEQYCGDTDGCSVSIAIFDNTESLTIPRRKRDLDLYTEGGGEKWSLWEVDSGTIPFASGSLSDAERIGIGTGYEALMCWFIEWDTGIRLPDAFALEIESVDIDGSLMEFPGRCSLRIDD